MSSISSNLTGSSPAYQIRPDDLKSEALKSNARDLLESGNDIVQPDKSELKEAFNDFVGQTLFGQLLKSMRTTVGKPAYFHGGQTEEIFQAQLDNVLTEELTEASAESFANPMFELFQMSRP